MTKFNDTTIYFANLIKIENGEKKLYKEDACLLYRTKTDHFYSLEQTFNLFLEFEDKRTQNEDEIIEFYQIIQKHSYPYISDDQEGYIYVDTSSIKILENGEKHGNTRT